MRILFALLLCTLTACASDKITLSITVTNFTTNGMTFTVNGNTRTFTNNVTQATTQVATNATATGSKTNLFSQIGLNPFSGISAVDTGTNSFQLVGACGGAMIASASAGWATLTLSTQTCASATPVGIPFGAYYPNLNSRTNVASQLVTDENNYSTNSINQNQPIASQLVGTTNTQTVTGNKTFSNSSGTWNGSVVAAPQISGNVANLTNGVWTNAFLLNPIMTNAFNFGAAFRSPGSGLNSDQFGSGASATGNNSLAVGTSSLATDLGATAIGNNANATQGSSTAVGAYSLASGQSSVAIGSGAWASNSQAIAIGYFSVAADSGIAIGVNSYAGTNSVAFGYGATAAHTNSVAIGINSATTGNNQFMIGTSSQTAVAPGSMSISNGLTVGTITNITASGTNNFPTGADIAFGLYALSSLANGNNAAIPVGTNVFVQVSGPSGAFTINGIAGGRDGKLLIIYNGTGQDMTIANQSGTDPTAANRIITMTGADRATTGNGCACLIYSGSASRWILFSLDQ